VRGASREADDVGRLLSSRWTPPRAVQPVNPATIPSEAVAAAAANLARRVEGLSREDAWQIANGACEASNLIQAGRSWEDASDYMMGKPPALKYRIQAEELLKDLAQANSSSDVIKVLGKAAFCEAADRKT
jgi:hypothetical protein